jgi:hypothetical protein
MTKQSDEAEQLEIMSKDEYSDEPVECVSENMYPTGKQTDSPQSAKSGEIVKDVPTTQDWQERFDDYIDGVYATAKNTIEINVKIKDFISTELDAARQEERRKILALVDTQKGIHRGSWLLHPDWISRAELRRKIEQMGEV